jgi:hypothetical protein
MVDLLMREGAITPQFVAVVLAVDLETPVFSKERASLLEFLPESFAYKPLDSADPLIAERHPDAVTQAVVAKSGGTAAPADGPSRHIARGLAAR